MADSTVVTAARFREVVASGLVGQHVLVVTGVPGLGSLFELGTWVPRVHPIANPALSPRHRAFRGTNSLYAQCLWELYSPVDLYPPAEAPAGGEEVMVLLKVLEGQQIGAVDFVSDGLDIRLRFGGGLRLTLFPRQEGFGSDGYSVSFGHDYWSAEADGTATKWTAPD